MAGGVGVASWAGAAGVECAIEVAFGAKAPGICFLELRLLRGGVALHWAGVPASLSTSIGETSVVKVVDAAAAYDWEAVEVGVVAASGEAVVGSVSIGVDCVSLIRLGARCLPVVGGGLRKGKKLPSFLEGPALFWPWAMVGKKVVPVRLVVCQKSQERVLEVYWW